MFIEYFNGKENQGILFSILCDYLIKNHKIEKNDIIKLNIYNRLSGLMKNISERIKLEELRNYQSKEEQVGYVNKVVLSKCIPGFSNLIQQYLKQKNEEIDTISKPFITNNKNTNSNYNQLLDNLNKERSNQFSSNEKPFISTTLMENNKEIYNTPPIKKVNTSNENADMVQNMIKFDKFQETHKNKEVEFQNRLEILKQQRENFFQDNMRDNKINSNNYSTISDAKPCQNSNTNNDFDRSSSNIPLNKSTSSTLSTLSNTSNINILDQNQVEKHILDTAVLPNENNSDKFLKMQKIIPKNINSNCAVIPNEKFEKNPVPIKETVETCLVVINAADRKWYGNWTQDKDGNDILSPSVNENRYNFTIKFSSDQMENNLIYIKESLKNISVIEISDVILSTHDNPSLIGINKKDIIFKNISQEELVSIENKSNNENNENNENNGKIIDKIKENIIEEKKCVLNKFIYYNIYTYPYLLINIEEYTGNLVTTNKNKDKFTGRLAIGKNYVNNSFCRNNDIVQGYILMKPLVSTNNCSITFNPTPLPNLDKLTISLNKPDGELYASENAWNIDNLNILGIDVTDDNINICVYPPFHPSMYLGGDSIQIKQFEFLIVEKCLVKIKNSISDDELKIKSFFNNKKSIYIQKTSYIPYKDLNYANSSDIDCICEFRNIISIGNPIIVDKFCNYNYCFSNKGKWSAGGQLININIQPIYTLNISYYTNLLEKKSLNI